MEYFKSTADNYKQFYQNRNININWKPEHSFDRAEPLLGEFGICGSQVLALEYMVEHNIPEMIVFEDDVQLTDKFLDYLNLAYKDLPDDYDFLADSTVFPNGRFFNNHPQSILIKSDYICRSDLQNAHLGFMLYSLKGAKKILALLKEDGFFAPIDTMLFYHSRHRKLEGYTTFFFNRLISDKDFYGSMIDLDNIRR
jgi:GR25 family glycosyltransferase involved in LPS biosynthesis